MAEQDLGELTQALSDRIDTVVGVAVGKLAENYGQACNDLLNAKQLGDISRSGEISDLQTRLDSLQAEVMRLGEGLAQLRKKAPVVAPETAVPVEEVTA